MAGSPEDIRWPESLRNSQKEVVSPKDIADNRDEVARLLNRHTATPAIVGKIIWPEKTVAHASEEHKHPTSLSTDPVVHEVQSALYNGLGIDVRTDANGAIDKFKKWVIDGLVVGNGELARMIYTEGAGKFLTAIKEQLSTIEGWWKIAEALGTSVKELFLGDAYERGKSVADLGLITTGIAAVGSVAKMAGKTAVRTSMKIGAETTVHQGANTVLYWLGRGAEKIGAGLQMPLKGVIKVGEEVGKAVKYTGEITKINTGLRKTGEITREVFEKSGTKKVVEWTKQAVKNGLEQWAEKVWSSKVVQKVKSKIDDVMENRANTRYDKLEAEWKLLPKERLDIDMYSPEQLTGLKKRLGIAETATKEEIEKAYRLKLHDAMEQYEKLGKQNLERIGMDIMEQMRRNGVKDPKKEIGEEIKAVKEAYEKGEIKIVRVEAYNANIPIEGFRSPYQIGNGEIVRPKYGKKREEIDIQLGLRWLDAKYATVLVNQKELEAMMMKYASDWIKPMASVFTLWELQWRSGMTLYDTMLVGANGKWLQYVLDFNDLFTVRALKNMEKWYNKNNIKYWWFEEMRQSTVKNTEEKWEKLMYGRMDNFMELQIMGRIHPVKEQYIWTDTSKIFNK